MAGNRLEASRLPVVRLSPCSRRWNRRGPAAPVSLKLEDGEVMSDGREEREELKRRREQEQQQDREDWLNHGEPDGLEPERTDS